jgi:hypothetical protein
MVDVDSAIFDVSLVPYAENKVEHKMNLVWIGHKEKNIYFSAKR